MSEAPAGPITKPQRELADFKIPDRWKDKDEAPRISLGGHEFAVPPMSGRNIAQFSKMAIGLKVGAGMTDGNVDENFERLYRVVHFGLLRAYPDLEFDEFYDLPVPPDDLEAAFMVVAKAAGLSLKAVPVGEAQAAESAQTPSQADGTTSLSG